MKCLITFTSVFLITIHCIAQSYSEDNKKFSLGNYQYEISVKETDDQYGYETFIKIYKIQNERKYVQKTVKINNTRYDADLISFGEYINKKKKFILIRHRYTFYILNFYNNKILGPFAPKFYGIGQDAQSGMIADLKIIYNGRFLIGYSVDNGTFMYDLTHLYQAEEVVPATFPVYSENRVYLIKQLDNKGKQLGLFLYNKNWECMHTFLFKDKVIQKVEHPKIDPDKDSEEQLSESEFPEADYSYTILKEILPEENYRFSVYENYSGKEIILPDSLKSSNERKIKTYLNKL